jgi:hypothetical protein
MINMSRVWNGQVVIVDSCSGCPDCRPSLNYKTKEIVARCHQTGKIICDINAIQPGCPLGEVIEASFVEALEVFALPGSDCLDNG